MPIPNFTPLRGAILICDYDMATIPPEMRKKRRVVVISPRSYNNPGPVRPGGAAPGKCIVVPLSATEPRDPRASHVHIPLGGYKSLTEPVWAICEMVGHVSHSRLDRVNEGGKFLSETMSADDMAKIEKAMLHAIGMPPTITGAASIEEKPDPGGKG